MCSSSMAISPVLAFSDGTGHLLRQPAVEGPGRQRRAQPPGRRPGCARRSGGSAGPPLTIRVSQAHRSGWPPSCASAANMPALEDDRHQLDPARPGGRPRRCGRPRGTPCTSASSSRPLHSGKALGRRGRRGPTAWAACRHPRTRVRVTRNRNAGSRKTSLIRGVHRQAAVGVPGDPRRGCTPAARPGRRRSRRPAGPGPATRAGSRRRRSGRRTTPPRWRPANAPRAVQLAQEAGDDARGAARAARRCWARRPATGSGAPALSRSMVISRRTLSWR